MADIDLKTATPDASINDSAVLFGADSQASANPSVYSVATVRSHFVGAGTLNVASGKTLTGSNTLTLAGTDATTMTFPATSGTVATLNTAQTFTATQTITPAVNTNALAATGYSLTGSASASFMDLAGTWNTTGSPTAIKLNITNSNSNAASLLMDLQVGGASVASVRRDGRLTLSGPGSDAAYIIGTAPFRPGSIAIGLANGAGNGGCAFGDGTGANFYGACGANGFVVSSANYYGWTPGSLSSTTDTFLTRRGAANLRLGAADAAAPVAQTLSVQSVVAGTSNTLGAAFTITGSQGTGSGAGGSIIFQVAPAGAAPTVQNALASPLVLKSNGDLYIQYINTSSGLFYGSTSSGDSGGATIVMAGSGGSTALKLNDNGSLGFTSGFGSGTLDTILRRDAANTLALRNGTAAQTFRVYNTFTDVSNYERAEMRWNSNRFEIGFGKGGSGSLRDIGVFAGAVLRLGGGGNAVTQWQINASGHFLGGTDNTYDIGEVSATRPRSVYVGTSITPGAGVVVASLPTPSTGMIARVTDALAPTIGTTVAGGGAAYALVNYNGANWTVIGV